MKVSQIDLVLEKIAMSPGVDPIVGYILDYLFKNQVRNAIKSDASFTYLRDHP